MAKLTLKRLSVIAVGLTSAVLTTVPASAAPSARATTDVAAAAAAPLQAKVMSQNLYIGADLGRLLAGEPPAALLATVQQTNYPERSAKIAEIISANDPDLIGLQEVSNITVFTTSGATLLQLNYLDILLAQLSARGENYGVASVVTNSNVTLPVDLASGTFASVVDRDVILYRQSTTQVSNPVSANFDVNFTVDFGGVPVEFTRGYTMVRAQIGTKQFNFVNTHLEIEGAPCLNGTTVVVCQEVQSVQLRNAIRNLPGATVLVGDLNARPGTKAFNTIKKAGFIDTWPVGRPSSTAKGFTCCQDELLNNASSKMSERIDHIFLSRKGASNLTATSTVLGDEIADKTPSGLWPSDHGAPFATLRFRVA